MNAPIIICLNRKRATTNHCNARSSGAANHNDFVVGQLSAEHEWGRARETAVLALFALYSSLRLCCSYTNISQRWFNIQRVSTKYPTKPTGTTSSQKLAGLTKSLQLYCTWAQWCFELNANLCMLTCSPRQC